MGTSRQKLIALASVAIVFFVITELAGEHHSGFRNAVGWFGFLLSLLALIVVGVLVLVWRRRRAAP